MGGGLIEIVKFEKPENIKIIDVAVSSIPSAVRGFEGPLVTRQNTFRPHRPPTFDILSITIPYHYLATMFGPFRPTLPLSGGLLW